MTSVRLFAVVFACVTFSSPLAAQEKIQESPYYPFAIGTAWHYRGGENRVVARVVKHEKIGDVLCAVVETKVGDASATEHIGLTKEGIARFAANGEKCEPPVLMLKLPPQKGSWKVESKSGDTVTKATMELVEKQVEVPIGKYGAIQVEAEVPVAEFSIRMSHLYAKGVGIVKFSLTHGEQSTVMELEKFEKGK